MKTLLIPLCALAIVIAGQGCKSPTVPLQPGDVIMLKGTNAYDRAAEIRRVTGNDLNHIGAAITITVPTSVGASR